jgi:hypothetical protein
MKLSANDLASLACQAVIGGILGGMYAFGTLYCDRKSGALLSVRTDALHIDRILLSYCRELERRTKHIDLISFLQTIDAIDRIVALRFRLQDKKIPATRDDSDEAFTQLARLHATMKLLVQNCASQMSIKEHVDLERLATKMVDIGVDGHMKAIAVLTKHTK